MVLSEARVIVAEGLMGRVSFVAKASLRMRSRDRAEAGVCFWSSAKTREHVGTTGAWSRGIVYLILVDRTHVGWSDTQSLDMGTFAARGEGTGRAEIVGRKVVKRHLRGSASVHCSEVFEWKMAVQTNGEM